MNQSPNQTLYSTVVKLTATQNGSVPATQGRLANAAFLDIIKTVDPVLSKTIHDHDGRKPFTVSPLQGLDRARNGRVKIERGQSAWLRFTLLDSQLFTTLTQNLLTPGIPKSPWPTIRIGEINFTITEMLTTPGSHPWAGYTTVSELCRQWQLALPDESNRKIAIEFASGTMFSRSSNKNGMGKFIELFPHPAMFFGSVAAMWNDQTGVSLDKQAIREYAKETVVVSAYKMESRLFHYWGNPQIGAIGRITYQLKDTDDQEMLRTLNCLANFAFYSGVGAKTTMGMGQARRVTRLPKR